MGRSSTSISRRAHRPAKKPHAAIKMNLWTSVRQVRKKASFQQFPFRSEERCSRWQGIPHWELRLRGAMRQTFRAIDDPLRERRCIQGRTPSCDRPLLFRPHPLSFLYSPNPGSPLLLWLGPRRAFKASLCLACYSRERNRSAFAGLRQRVRARDHHCCRVCGRQAERLHVHHRRPGR